MDDEPEEIIIPTETQGVQALRRAGLIVFLGATSVLVVATLVTLLI